MAGIGASYGSGPSSGFRVGGGYGPRTAGGGGYTGGGGSAGTGGGAPGGGAGGGNEEAIRRAMQQAMGSFTQAGPSSGSTTNSAEANPTSKAAIDAMMKRAGGDMGAAGALDAGIQDIRARASLGIGRENELNQAMSGMSNSSIVGSDSQELSRRQGADINRLTTDITLGRERDRDALYQAAGNMGLAQGGQQLQAQAGAREQHRMDQQAAYEQRNAYMQNFSTILSLLRGKSEVV